MNADNILKTCLWVVLFFISTIGVSAQESTITLQKCLESAVAGYPLAKNINLIDESGNLLIKNIQSNNYPKLSIYGQYTVQSEVTSLPIAVPGMTVPELDKNQYRIVGEISQSIYDGGIVRHQKEITTQRKYADIESVNVELAKVKERVSQLYFSILFLDAQTLLTKNLIKDLDKAFQKSEAAYKNGVLLKSSVDVIRAEIINAGQRLIELNSDRKTLLSSLAMLTGHTLDENTLFEIPSVPDISDKLKRAELSIFHHQLTSLSGQKGLIISNNLPKVNLFFQSGYGLPGLNMLKADPSSWYIAGIRLSYSLNNIYNIKRDMAINTIARQMVNTQQESFELNTSLQLLKITNELNKLKELIAKDQEIIELRNNIAGSALSQFENGVLTGSDYLHELIKADNARQLLIMHQVQLLQSYYNHKLTTGQL